MPVSVLMESSGLVPGQVSFVLSVHVCTVNMPCRALPSPGEPTGQCLGSWNLPAQFMFSVPRRFFSVTGALSRLPQGRTYILKSWATCGVGYFDVIF